MAVEVFSNDAQMFDRLFVLTESAVHAANPDKDKLRNRAQIGEGTPVMQVVPDAEEIPYASIVSVEANKFGSGLDINYRKGTEKSSKNVTFKDADSKNVALSALERRLAPGFERSEVQLGVIRAALAPLGFTAGLAAFTYVAVRAAQQQAAGDTADVHGKGKLLKWFFVFLLWLLGPTGIGILGGLLVVCALAWLVARVKQPPLMITLAPAASK